ncbi:DUF1349 domain-containing protein [Aquimarina sp. U1-2]|uniref:DUF1349 domain-containing protein n=1 Tax=Aquimarina sp. U1-2 TaxID=2823141 RepID=UPI001AECA66E|nr:DUF1349 domain-containing protein [Aquimarina sp. U1-2]MBP2831276.1 DUF1349 domain-containing protein [Aquimarina sp. U1-2]
MKYYFLAFIVMTAFSIQAQEKFVSGFNSDKNLKDWSQLTIEGWKSKIRTLKVENGKLIYEPTSSGWFEDNYAGFLYREFQGNFELTTKVKVEGTNSKLPKTSFSLAGLFVRAPREVNSKNWKPKGENWMFFSIGSATEPEKPQFEIKSTYSSQSTLKIYPAKAEWVELKIVRVSEIFTLLHKFEGEEWKILDQFIRPDLPETLQLGITAYSDWPSVSEIYPNYEEYNRNGTKNDDGDLIAYFDYVSIKKGVVEKELPIANFIGKEVLKNLK